MIEVDLLYSLEVANEAVFLAVGGLFGFFVVVICVWMIYIMKVLFEEYLGNLRLERDRLKLELEEVGRRTG
jgi:hypothetical protein